MRSSPARLSPGMVSWCTRCSSPEAIQMEHVIDPFVSLLAVFVLAIFVGYYVVWNVTPALHTPLMSVTNAISSVIVVGALLAVGAGAIASGSTLAMVFGFLALVLATVTICAPFHARVAFGIGDINAIHTQSLIEMSLGAAIGAITFTGSIVAFTKLQGLVSGAPVTFPNQHWLNLGLGILLLVLIVFFVMAQS